MDRPSLRLSEKRKVRPSAEATLGVGHHALTLDRFDPDALQGVISGTEVLHTLLPGGRPSFEHHRLHFGEACVSTGRYGAAVRAEGAWPAGTVSIGFAVEAPAPVMVNGYVGRLSSVQFYAEGTTIDYRAAPNTTWMAYTISRERLQQAMELRAGRPLSLPEGGVWSFDPEPAAAAKLRAWLGRAVVARTDRLNDTGRALWARRTEEGLQRRLVDVFMGPPRPSSAFVRPEGRRIVARAEEYIRSRLEAPFDLAALARAVGTSERMVQYHFKRIYGTTPGAWLRAKRLHAVRSELRRSSASRSRVTDVALRAGFRHLGRFSVEYRRLFGETPRETLRG